MKVSIIIPVYNGEKYLAECILSCLDQTYQDYEIIIVNDGSTDGTEKIINRFQKNYQKIRSIYKSNGGTASALNLGIESMRGEWFKWLSADDVLLPETLSQMIMYIENKVSNPHKFLYYTDYEVIDEHGKYVRVQNEPHRSNTNGIAAAEQYIGFFGNGSTSLMHISTLHVVGKFRENMALSEDYEFWLRWGLKFKFGFRHIPIIGIQYREHSQSLTSIKNDIIRSTNNALRKEYRKYLDKFQLWYINSQYIPLKKKITNHIPYPILKVLLRVKHL